MDPSRKDPPHATPPAVAPRRRARRLPWLVLLLALVAALAWWHPWSPRTAPADAGATRARAGGRAGAGRFGAMQNQPQAVRAATAVRGEVPIVLTALGTVTPFSTVTVRTQIAGTLMKVAFSEGQTVRAGDLLAQVDPRPYEISLRNAQGALARDEALLAQARQNLARYSTLLKQDSIAQQQVDDQAALVRQYEGTVQADRAQVATYQLDLTYCRITAPISGRVGLRQVDAGNYVQTGDTNGIVVITQMQPISVIFTLPEDALQRVLQRTSAGAQLSVSIFDRSDSNLLDTGKLLTVDNQIDTSTGTVKLRASFPNAAQRLFPNQFVNTRLLVDTLRDAVIVPSSAIQNGSIGNFVYVIGGDNKVAVRKVQTGPADGERTSIASGLAVGERVVIDGADRLREGAPVTVPQAASGATAAPDAVAAASGSLGRRTGRHGHASAPAGQTP
jgi:multidrug efflux system membrane fusion protein